MPTIEDVTRKYIELRNRKAERAKEHQEELRPLSEAMVAIENFILEQMNQLGVDSFKTSAGTPYKANQNSVGITDAQAFKAEVFLPAVQGIYHYLSACGHSLQQADIDAIKSLLQEKTKWDIVDFRAGKKGVLEYLENNNKLPAGIDLQTITVVNVRKA